MSARYLQFNIFGMALADMAVENGTLTKRLTAAYYSYLYKIDWEKDSEFLEAECLGDFLALKKILHDDLLICIENDKKTVLDDYTRHGMRLSSAKLGEMINARSVLRGFHYTKSRRAVV